MSKNERKLNIVFLICSLLTVASVIITALKLLEIRDYGFELSEFWQIFVLLFPLSLLSVVFSLSALCKSAVYYAKTEYIQTLKDREQMRREERGETVEETEDEPVAPVEIRFKRTKTIFALLIALICCYCAYWSMTPDELCYHNFTYSVELNERDRNAEEAESYNFYENYIGTIFYNYKVKTIAKYSDYRIKAIEKSSGTDECGDYVKYRFLRTFSVKSALLTAPKEYKIDDEVYLYTDKGFMKINGLYYSYKRMTK